MAGDRRVGGAQAGQDRAVFVTGDLGVWSVEDALAALRGGEAVLVAIGVAGERSFVKTSSTGIYVDLVAASRRLEPALGRRVAAVVALIQVLRRGGRMS